MKSKILLIDDDASLRRVLEFHLHEEGYEVQAASSGEEGLYWFDQARPDLVITDMKMSGMDGLTVLKSIKERSPETLVIIITAFGTVEVAVEAMKAGAHDYITKPFNRDELKLTVKKALAFTVLARENQRLRRELCDQADLRSMVGASREMDKVFQTIRKVADTDVAVLITGESGTGKELVARSLHATSSRREAPFVAINPLHEVPMAPQIRFLTIAAGIILTATLAAAADQIPPEHLPTLISTALASNPELKSSQARWQTFVNRARQAGSLDDPMFMFKLQNMVAREPLSFSKDPQTAKVIGISQQLPFWGKRALREEAAQHEADSYQWAAEERKLELTRMVKESYYQLYAVDRSLEVVARNLKLLADLKAIAEAKYAVGQGVQQDIFRAGLETSRMLEMQITLRQQRRSQEASLNYLLSRPESTPVGRIADFDLPQLTVTAERLQVTAAEMRPLIRSLTSLVNKGETTRRLAEKEQYPDVNLSFEYMFREETMNDPGYNMYSVGFTVNLPLQRERRQAMVAEASSETAMSRDELQALRNSIGYAVGDLLAQMERRRQLVELYRGGIIPQAEQSLESALISYKVNKVDFPAVLDDRMSLFTYERELYESQADYMMRLAQLEAVVGVDLGESKSK